MQGDASETYIESVTSFFVYYVIQAEFLLNILFESEAGKMTKGGIASDSTPKYFSYIVASSGSTPSSLQQRRYDGYKLTIFIGLPALPKLPYWSGSVV